MNVHVNFKSNKRTKAHSASLIESTYYELKPFLVAALGIAAMGVKTGNVLRIPFAVILLFCAAVILKWRAQARFGR
jgi:uncharacterized membrane protein